jgi:methionine-rich copper-binding protein CopC
MFIPGVKETTSVPFSFYLPFPKNSKKMKITRQISTGNETTLIERTFSEIKPAVQIKTPKTKQTISGNYRVEWTATDQDKDALTYDLVYSADGTNWQVIAVNLTETAWNWNTTLSEKSSKGILKVIANDGINEGFSTVDSLNINNLTDIEKFTITLDNLEQNYPNPFSDFTNIGFTLSESGRVILKIHNMLGEEIATLLDKNLNKGRHNVQWNAGSLPSGIYIYQLNHGNYTSTGKMILQK